MRYQFVTRSIHRKCFKAQNLCLDFLNFFCYHNCYLQCRFHKLKDYLCVILQTFFLSHCIFVVKLVNVFSVCVFLICQVIRSYGQFVLVLLIILYSVLFGMKQASSIFFKLRFNDWCLCTPMP